MKKAVACDIGDRKHRQPRDVCATRRIDVNLRALAILKRNEGKVVRVTFNDGEAALASVIDVSEEDEDVIYRLVSTNRPDKYEKTDLEPTLPASLQSVVSAEEESA